MRDHATQHDFFIGIDSDGCVFDTMELKWKECFIPRIVEFYQLQGVSRLARETIEFVNLYAKDRGCNRFIGLIKSLDLLSQRPEVAARGFAEKCIVATSLRTWVNTESKLGNTALAEHLAESSDEDLTHALNWSTAVNQSIAELVRGVPPFPLVRESLKRLSERAEMIVCSSTPAAALEAEWAEHEIDRFVGRICGQEHGSKRETLSPSKRFEAGKRLMIGDAPGDLLAAEANDCLFYPINPGQEEASWRRFHDEALEKFFGGTFAGEYQQQLITEFDTYLPEHPPWLKATT